MKIVSFYFLFICLFVCLTDFGATAPVGQGLLIYDISRSHTTTHHSRQDSSGRVISSSQRPLPDMTQHSQHKHRCPRWDSNPRSQQASGRRPTPQTARPPGPAIVYFMVFLINLVFIYYMYYYERNQQDATVQVDLLFLVSSTCFGRCFRPSSGALDCIYSIWQYSSKLLPAGVLDELKLK